MGVRFKSLSIIALVTLAACSSGGASIPSAQSGAFDPLPPASTSLGRYVLTTVQNGTGTVDVTSGFPAGYGQVHVVLPSLSTSLQISQVPLTVTVYAPNQGTGLDYVPSLPAPSFYIDMQFGEDLHYSKLPGLTISMQQPPKFKHLLYYDGVAWQTVATGSVQGNSETFAPSGTTASFVSGTWYVFAVE